MCFFKAMYSAVMMLPALFSGYCKNRLISFRVEGRAFFSTLFTTLAGNSSSISTASSTNSSSMTVCSSASVILSIISCCFSTGRKANTSVACSLGSMRKTTTVFSLFSSSIKSAVSASGS